MKKFQYPLVLAVVITVFLLSSSCRKGTDAYGNQYGQPTNGSNGTYLPPVLPQISTYTVLFKSKPLEHPQSMMIDKNGDGVVETEMYPQGCNIDGSGLPNNAVVLASFNTQEQLRIDMTQHPSWNWYGEVMDGYEALTDQFNQIYAYHFWGYYVASIYDIHRVVNLKDETFVDVTNSPEFKHWFKVTYDVDFFKTTATQRAKLRKDHPEKEMPRVN